MSDTRAEPATAGVAAAWNRFWFTPADPRPLAIVRILTAALGLLLLWSQAADLTAWFGPEGAIPVATAARWRPPGGFSIFDHATSSLSLQALFGGTVLVFACLLVGLCTDVAAVAAAVLWASLMHRGPMLAGGADDCLAVLLWCLAIGPAGRCFSVDRLIAARAGRPAPPESSVRARIALGLIQVHAAAIAAAAVIAQLRGDVWWDGTAAWWLATRRESRIVDLTALYARSELCMNLVTHLIPAFAIAFMIGIWVAPLQRAVSRAGLVAWPLIGVVAGEPLWGLAVAIFALPTCGFFPSRSDGSA
jgi:hypothetical protein